MPNAGSSGAQGVTQENPDEHADQTKEHEKTAKACRTQMTSVPRPDGVLDWSPFGNVEDNHSVDRFWDEDAKSVQDDEGPPYAMVGKDEISQKGEWLKNPQELDTHSHLVLMNEPGGLP